MTLEATLRWKKHVKHTREELGLKYKEIYWLMGRRSALSIYNKLLPYKQILRPVWTYGLQLFGCPNYRNFDIIHQFQNVVIRNIVDATWHIRNGDIHTDFQIEMFTDQIGKFANKHAERRLHHVDVKCTIKTVNVR
jgi:hypothetical protein